jgi:hypothetical protein
LNIHGDDGGFIVALFATANYGTTAGLVLLLLIAWAVVILIVSFCIVVGIFLCKSGSSSTTKRTGVLLILLSGFLPCSCYLGPPHVTRLVYGNYPVGRDADNKVKVGMTEGEVKAILGSPHERDEESVLAQRELEVCLRGVSDGKGQGESLTTL